MLHLGNENVQVSKLGPVIYGLLSCIAEWKFMCKFEGDKITLSPCTFSFWGHCLDYLWCAWYQVLFRERGILSFFHAGKMTTHHGKIPHFCCSYFWPCVCVPLFGPGGPVFKVHMVISVWTWICNKSWENSVFLLWLLPAYVCVQRDVTGVMWKFCIFVVAISGLCVCICVCVCMCCDVQCDSCAKIPCFHCSYFWLMCVFVCSALCLDRAGPALRCSSIVGISKSETKCVPCCQLPHFATLIFGYS